MNLNIKFTNAGKAALINPDNVGTNALEITHFELGSAAYNPTGNETQLQAPIKTISAFGGEVVANDTLHISFRDDSDDSYSVGEIGLRSGEGVLMAIISSADMNPITQKGQYDILLMSADAQLTEIDVSNLTFGNTDFIYSDANLNRKGIVKLSSSTDSDSESEASTPKAVKNAKEEAIAAAVQQASHSHPFAPTNHSHQEDELPSASLLYSGVCKLSNSISSDSQTEASTPHAVKKVMEKMNETTLVSHSANNRQWVDLNSNHDGWNVIITQSNLAFTVFFHSDFLSETTDPDDSIIKCYYPTPEWATPEDSYIYVGIMEAQLGLNGKAMGRFTVQKREKTNGNFVTNAILWKHFKIKSHDLF